MDSDDLNKIGRRIGSDQLCCQARGIPSLRMAEVSLAANALC